MAGTTLENTNTGGLDAHRMVWENGVNLRETGEETRVHRESKPKEARDTKPACI